QADHSLLYSFAKDNGGSMVYPAQLAQIEQALSENPTVVTVAHETKILSDLINKQWLLWLLLAFLCGEWLLRKRNGTY
ncbi:MAG: VWA domain-containing protein, partial [Flavobacteriales bacterium]|nr:VWA domain-containing protein [Flavobacteriales bacterium]